MLTLSVSQYDALCDDRIAAFAVRAQPTVRKHWPEYAQMPDAELSALLTELGQRARNYGLDDDRSALRLLNLETAFGQDFSGHPCGSEITKTLAQEMNPNTAFPKIHALLRTAQRH